MISRDADNPRSSSSSEGGEKQELDALEFKQYAEKGYIVYLYALVINLDQLKNVVRYYKADSSSIYYSMEDLFIDVI